jgi:hypothetical protein
MEYTNKWNGLPAQTMAAIEKALKLMVQPEAYYYVRAGSIYEWSGDNFKILYDYQ